MTILPYDRSRLHAMLVALDQQAERDLRRHLLHARHDTAVLMRAENRSRRVLQALDYAKDPALKRLRLQFSQVDIATIWPQLSEICHDVALCLGMATLASQAALEAMLAQVFNAGAMGKSMVAGLRDAGSTYRMGLGKLWGADPARARFVVSDLHRPAPHASMVAADFAHGHVLAVTAMLRSVSLGLRHGSMRRQAILGAAMHNARLGPKVAMWLARNELALARHPSLQARTAAIETAPAMLARTTPATAVKGVVANANKVARDMEILRFYAAQGNREAYWNYLAAGGDRYAQLALGVVRNDTISGVIANGYAQMRADQLGRVMSERDWHQFGIELMRADLGYRELNLAKSMALGKIAPLSVEDVARYHTVIFKDFLLDSKAWTAHVPLSPYLDAHDVAGAEKVWQAMLDERFYVNASRVLRSEGRALLNGVNSMEHAAWLGKIGVLTSGYVLDPFQAYADADKIGSWRYANGAWSRMHFDYPATMDGSFGMDIAPERLRKQLDLDRLFRLERLRPMDKHPQDLSHLMPGK